ncbi:MAG: macrolide family glycosyltransferase, partial [Mycobacteriales bacterium]
MHITYLVVPGHGHINPTLGVVAELAKRGHRVTYPVPEMFTDAIRAVGAEPVLYESPLHQTWDPRRRFDGSFYASLQLGLLEETLVMLPKLEKHLAGDLPDLIVYDRLMPFAARVLGYAWNRPLVATSPTLVSNEHFSLWGEFAKQGVTPPADNDPVVVEFRKHFAAFAAGRGVPPDRIDAMRETSTSGGDPMVVFVPERFQPAGNTFDERYAFVGPCLAGRSHQGDWRPSDEGPVLLISLGTGANDRPEFFRACAEAFAGTPWQVVMSIGTWLDPADLGPLPHNVTAHPHVPQIQVLRHARAFVSHGGMGSTMEALY